MKIDSIEIVQHVSAILLLVFCVLYSYSHEGIYYTGLLTWITILIPLYFYNVVKISGIDEENMRTRKKLSVVLSWILALFLLGLRSEDLFLLFISALILGLSFVLIIRGKIGP
jgi:phosphatidylserine synthase